MALDCLTACQGGIHFAQHETRTRDSLFAFKAKRFEVNVDALRSFDVSLLQIKSAATGCLHQWNELICVTRIIHASGRTIKECRDRVAIGFHVNKG